MKLTVSQKIERLSELAADKTSSSLIYQRHKASLTDALELAGVIKQVEDLMTPDVLEKFESLQGKAVGFLTDRDQTGGYPARELKDPMVEAIVAGFLPLNNEVNIIGGRMMPVKNGLRRKILEHPDVTNFVLTSGQPTMKRGGDIAAVPIWAEWMFAGRAEKREWTGDRAIRVRLNKGMGGDGAVGKAERKAMKAVWEQLIGCQPAFADEDDGAIDITPQSPTPGPDDDVIAEIQASGMDEAGVQDPRGTELFESHEQA